MTPSSPATTALSTGDHVFLCMLTAGSRSAWDLHREMERSVGHFWITRRSQLYQQARRLVRDGYVSEEAVAGHPRRRKLLSLTRKGREAVGEWLRQPPGLPQYHVEGLVKLYFAEVAGDPAATVEMIAAERELVRARLAQLESQLRVLTEHDGSLYQTLVVEAGIETLRTTIACQTRAMRKVARERLNGRADSTAS